MNRREHLTFAVSNLRPGHVLEFGVGGGRSLSWIVHHVNDKRVFAFDSFEGLPEEWVCSDTVTIPKGAFKYDPPEVYNVEYYIGLFEDTIPQWKEEHPGGISFIHVDSDLYSSCKTVLTQLNDRIVPGTILCFDEIYESIMFKNWQDGEYRALTEWCQQYNREVYELGRSNNGAATFRVLQ